jgi:hypothetical protein
VAARSTTSARSARAAAALPTVTDFKHRETRRPCSGGFAAPFPDDRVRLTSIYSNSDGVVRWQAQLVPYAECAEVTRSHVGLIFNRKSYRAIAQVLAAPEPSAQTLSVVSVRHP